MSELKTLQGDCWLYAGPTNYQGYGLIHSQYNKYFAHRVMYENEIGKIPENLVIDHLCRIKSCINPSHLEAVTSRENTLRGLGITAQHSRKTHCASGHELTGDNIVKISTQPNNRRCRKCDNQRRALLRRKAAVTAAAEKLRKGDVE